jgi:hypothetical protein
MRRHPTPGRRLMKFLMRAGGCLTLWQIARKSHNGRLLAEARQELDGLIVEEKGKTPNRGQRSGRPCTRVFLTMRGWAAANAIKPGWQPARLATPVLKAWLAELVEERDPWAMSLHEMPPKQFYKMQADAKELARLKEAKWIRPPLRRFGPKPGIQPANGFQRRDGSSPAPGQPIPPAAAFRPTVFGGGFDKPTPSAPYQPAAPAPSKLPKGIYDREGFCFWCHGTQEGHAGDCPHKAA